MKVSLTDLSEKLGQGISKLGYQGEDAQVVEEVLLYAETRGNDQGIVKLSTGGVPAADSVEPFRVIEQSRCGALVSGGNAMVAANRATAMAIDFASENGVGLVCSNHTFSSSGAIGYFVRKIARQGLIGFMCVGNGKFSFVAPFGSSEARFGTNPFAYAFPYDTGEVVFDNATAAISYYGLVEARLKGAQIPAGIGFDGDGAPSTDPAKILEGSVQAFAGHRGFGLSLLVQVLGGPLSMAGTPGINETDGAGKFILALDPEMFAPKGEFIRRVSALVREVKSAKALPGQEVLLPGERGDRFAQEIQDADEIELDDAIWDGLCAFVSN